jgi:hypothetical protein
VNRYCCFCVKFIRSLLIAGSSFAIAAPILPATPKAQFEIDYNIATDPEFFLAADPVAPTSVSFAGPGLAAVLVDLTLLDQTASAGSRSSQWSQLITAIPEPSSRFCVLLGLLLMGARVYFCDFLSRWRMLRRSQIA